MTNNPDSLSPGEKYQAWTAPKTGREIQPAETEKDIFAGMPEEEKAKIVDQAILDVGKDFAERVELEAKGPKMKLQQAAVEKGMTAGERQYQEEEARKIEIDNRIERLIADYWNREKGGSLDMEEEDIDAALGGLGAPKKGTTRKAA